ncbi:MAG: 50S ribosomal protein L6 [Candidatus Brocadiia bacterium]
MSRIGNQPVPLPQGVAAALGDGVVEITGPLGKLQQRVDDHRLRVLVDETPPQVRVERTDDQRQTKALHGLTRNLIRNMVVGVTEGYVRGLQVVGVGYSAKVEGQKLLLQLGYAHPVEVAIPDSVNIDPPETRSILVTGVGSVPCVTLRIRGIDKQAVGEFAARVRRLKPPEPYKAKGIRYEGEEVRRKAGKAFAVQE